MRTIYFCRNMAFGLLFFAPLLLLATCNKGTTHQDVPVEEQPGDTSTRDTMPGPGDPDFEPGNDAAFRQMLGINGFEWDYLNGSDFSEARFSLIKNFTAFRQYIDWDHIEYEEGKYRFSYDYIFQRNKESGILSLPCLQTMPKWFRKKYYPDEYNPNDYGSLREYVPVPKGASRTDPASYLHMGQLGFQVAARYGANKNIEDRLIKAVTWGDRRDVKIGLNTLEYIECRNEPDMFWHGPEAEQQPEEFAANLSAFYDGHMGTLGEGVGAKNADPNIKIVMGGLVSSTPEYVRKMVDWCKKNRVKDGGYTLCFDVINYHDYSAVRSGSYWDNPDLQKNHGVAPELGDAAKKAQAYVAFAREAANDMEVWVTESGYDVNPNSIQRALKISNKTIEETQADWILRSALLYARYGIDRVFFYMLKDVDVNSGTQYNSSGLVTGNTRRLSGDYLVQADNLIGDFRYARTLKTDPLIDVYVKGKETIYMLVVPDQKDRSETVQVEVGKSVTSVTLYRPVKGQDNMAEETVSVTDGKISATATETPLFVRVDAN